MAIPQTSQVEQTVRIPEWAEQKVSHLPSAARASIEAAVQGWMLDHNLPAPPLRFAGAEGSTLCTRNYVGVVEAGGVAVEIYPKLDAHLLGAKARIDQERQQSTMASLLWMLEVAHHHALFDTDTGSLETAPTTFMDVWASLLARNLHRELQFGLARAYQPVEDNATAIRGRVLFQQQLQANFTRPDRIYCGWDEFTEDRPLNRILKCACRFLSTRVANPEIHRLLTHCIAIFDEVEDLGADAALRQENRIVWDRSMQRFQLPFQLAIRLLRSIGHDPFHGGEQTYVFLLDMNQLFEDFVGAVLERRHGVPIDAQKDIGPLLVRPKRIRQKPDFSWKDREGNTFIADAKYKPFTWDDDTTDESKYFDPADTRQLIVYGLMAGSAPAATNLQLIYPYIGWDPRPKVMTNVTFNNMPLSAVPIPIRQGQAGLRSAW